jgi:hypothetical protein
MKTGHISLVRQQSEELLILGYKATNRKNNDIQPH